MKCANLERSRCRAQIWLWWMFNFDLRVPEPTLVFCCPAHGCKQSSMHGAVVTVLSLRCTARESNPSTLALQGHQSDGFAPGRACARYDRKLPTASDQCRHPVQLLQTRIKLTVVLREPVHFSLER